MKIKILFLSVFCFISHIKINAQIDCLYQILVAPEVSNQKFLECKKYLELDTTNSDLIFLRLCQALTSSEYRNFDDAAASVSFIPMDFNYYNFDSKPQPVHRFRAIQDIFKNQLQKKNVSYDIIVSEIKRTPDISLIQRILKKNRDRSEGYLSLLLNELFFKDIDLSDNEIFFVKKLVAQILINEDPKKYINIIAEYIFENKREELHNYVLHIFNSEQSKQYLTAFNREKLVLSLFKQIRRLEPYHAYFNIMAIERLTNVDLRDGVDLSISDPKEEDIPYKEIKEHALKSFSKIDLKGQVKK